MNAATVSKTIYDQIGQGAMFMMGAWNHLYGTDELGNTYLSFRIRGSKKANHVQITLTPLDLYDIELTKIRGLDFKPAGGRCSVYADQLKPCLESLTGLRLSL